MRKPGQLTRLIYITAIGMELCCLYLWLALLSKYLGFGFLVITLILALHPLSFFIKLVVTRSSRVGGRSPLFIALFAIAMVSAITGLAVWQTLTSHQPLAGVVLQIIFSGVSWWLGNTLVRAELDYAYICFRFQCGILAILAVLVFGGIETTGFLVVALFFTLAILCLVSARWETSHSGSLGVLRPLALPSMILGSAAVLVPGLFIFLVLSPDVARTTLHWLVMMAINLINLLGLNRLPQASEKPLEIGPISCSIGAEQGEMAPPPPPPTLDNTPMQISPIFIWTGIIVIFLGLILVILRTVRKIRARHQKQSAEVADVETAFVPASLFGWLIVLLAGVMKGLRHLWQSILRRLNLIRFRLVPVEEPMVSVRALYRSFLKWGTKQGFPRALSQTPSEYLGLLGRRFPEEDAELGLITKAYLRARYSSNTPTSEEFAAAKKAWQLIHNLH